MNAHIDEVLTGVLTRTDGTSDSFSCRLRIWSLDLTRRHSIEGVSLPISDGLVQWSYLRSSAKVVAGSVDIFATSENHPDPCSVSYIYQFVADDVEYLFRGERNLTSDLTSESSLVKAVIETPIGLVSQGVLSSQLRGPLHTEQRAPLEGQHNVPTTHVLQSYQDIRRPKLEGVDAQGSDAADRVGISRTLELLATVMLPTPLPANGPSIRDVRDRLLRFLRQGSGKTIKQIRALLQVIGIFIPLLEKEISRIRHVVEEILNNEKNSTVRQALTGIHQMVVFAYYSDRNADRLVGYARPSHRPNHRTTLSVSDAVPDRVFDIVIAGSGPAGALLADRLSSKGKSVLLLEAGPYLPEQDITTDEIDSVARLYKSSGLQTSSKPSSITVLQGTCVGGGGVINNGIFFPLPVQALQEWRNAGFPFDRKTLEDAYSEVAVDLNIGDVEVKARRLNPVGSFLEKKLGKLQAPPFGPVSPGFYRMMVNLETLAGDGETAGCRSTGLCNLGCGSERKVNSYQYYLKNALDGSRQVVLVPRAAVLRAVLQEGTTERRVRAFEVQMADGKRALARGKSFLLCCGPIASSEVLLRSPDVLRASGGRLPVGQRFCGNVASPVFGVAPTDVNEQTSVQMCQVFVPESDDGGFLIESWFSPPGGLALAMPGFLDVHAQRMSEYRRVMSVSPVIGSQPIGNIRLSAEETVIDLPLAPLDLDRFRRGMILLVTAMLDGGAGPVLVRLGNGRLISRMKDVEALDAEMQRLTPGDVGLLQLSTAHPQGGNALSEDAELGVVDANFRVRGIDNLRVCDGSVFPAVAGVNPQWTIFALAQLCASRID